MEVQEKILRVVEYGVFERVGSSNSIDVDVRIVAATNADLVEMASQNRFKQDLLDRLSFEVLFLPPLRDRREDIMLLAKHFAARMSFELKRQAIPRFSRDAVNALESYAWPGNIRELKNMVERAVYRSDSPIIKDIGFDPFHSPYSVPSMNQTEGQVHPAAPTTKTEDDLLENPFSEAVDAFKVRLLKRALKKARYNQRAAAGILGLSYHQFRGLYRKYNLM